LNWGAIRRNWLKVREGFYGSGIDKLSKATIAELIKRPGVYNNEKKVEAIIANAKKFQEIRQNFGSFSNFLKSLKRLKDRDAIKQITKQFKHVGEYTAEYYLHSIGYWK
jgi:DNA-3-methyladenine glycosylase I